MGISCLPGKKNGFYNRLVHDYRVINARCAPKTYSLPRIADISQHVQDATIFSSLDLKSAFWQLDVRPNDRKYRAFATHRQNYEYKKLPQGLTHASGTFQRFINYVLSHAEQGVHLFHFLQKTSSL